MRLRNYQQMKSNSVPKILRLCLVLIIPLMLSAILKGNLTAPVLPSAIYFLPADLTVKTQASIINKLYETNDLEELGLERNVLEVAMKGFSKLASGGKLNRDSILTIVDFSKSSKEKRMFVIDLKNAELLFNSLVAHGRNSGMEYARSFSNVAASHKSSLGFYITQNTYRGENGYSLRLKGVERNFNDRALARHIVIHGASYANDNFLQQNGILGRSFGCPAIPMENHQEIIDAIKEGTCLFIYSPDKKYLTHSTVLNG